MAADNGDHLSMRSSISASVAEARDDESSAEMVELDALRSGRVRLTPQSSLGADFIFYLRNTHVLISVCLAHRRHPYTSQRRKATLFNSLAFAVFLTALLLLAEVSASGRRRPRPLEFDESGDTGDTNPATLAARLPLCVSTALQLVWDVSGSMVGVCPCARDQKYPTAVRYGCGYAQLVCMTCNLLLGFLYGLIGLGLLLVMGPFFSVYSLEQFASLLILSKLAATLLAVPVALLLFLVLRACESPPPEEAPPGRLSEFTCGSFYDSGGFSLDRYYSGRAERESFSCGGHSAGGSFPGASEAAGRARGHSRGYSGAGSSLWGSCGGLIEGGSCAGSSIFSSLGESIGNSPRCASPVRGAGGGAAML